MFAWSSRTNNGSLPEGSGPSDPQSTYDRRRDQSAVLICQKARKSSLLRDGGFRDQRGHPRDPCAEPLAYPLDGEPNLASSRMGRFQNDRDPFQLFRQYAGGSVDLRAGGRPESSFARRGIGRMARKGSSQEEDPAFPSAPGISAAFRNRIYDFLASFSFYALSVVLGLREGNSGNASKGKPFPRSGVAQARETAFQ